ncbi:hypothetical protein HY844_02505 [Candidatus Berkelbacteria bacterium]|nr:hypothetical protein [Candidatus Berkelbacteria bacterium]
MPKNVELLYPKILALDTSEREQIRLALIVQSTSTVKKVINKQAQDLQQELDEFLSKNSVQLKDLDALAVVKNGPSLTGIRMGLVSVNTLAWLNGKPIIELENGFETSVNQLESGEKDFKIVKQVIPNA